MIPKQATPERLKEIDVILDGMTVSARSTEQLAWELREHIAWQEGEIERLRGEIEKYEEDRQLNDEMYCLRTRQLKDLESTRFCRNECFDYEPSYGRGLNGPINRGVVLEDPIRLKIPEMVSALALRVKELEAENERWKELAQQGARVANAVTDNVFASTWDNDTLLEHRRQPTTHNMKGGPARAGNR
jgi:hypothetical protein